MSHIVESMLDVLKDIRDILSGSSTTYTVANYYNSVSAVATGVETDVVTYTVPVSTTAKLLHCQFEGTNISLYKVKINGTTVAQYHTYFSGALNGKQIFEGGAGIGPEYAAGTIIKITTLHNRPNTGDFSGRIVVSEI